MIPKFYKEDHHRLAKDNCVVCGDNLKQEWKKYKLNGNFCKVCVSRANQLMMTKSKISFLERRIAEAKQEKNNYIMIVRERRRKIIDLKKAKRMLKSERLKLNILIKSAPQYYKGNLCLAT